MKISGSAESKMRFEIRGRAVHAMEDLIFILKNIKNVSKKPERDFAKIFNNDKQFISLIETLHWAYDESYKAPVKLAAEESWQILETALLTAGLGFKSNKALYNADYRLEMVRRLRRKEKVDGKQYFERIHRLILANKGAFAQKKEEISNRVVCPRCGLEQSPVDYIFCPGEKCGFQGPVLRNLYKGH